MIFDEQHRVIKIAAIVFGIDPLGNKRVLMRHNKPYDGKHIDEWTFVWGSVEEGENLIDAAQREAIEEFGPISFVEKKLLVETNEYLGLHGKSIAHFVTLKIQDINSKVVLNEESIGYDWMLIQDAIKLVRKYEIPILEKLDH